MRQFILLLCAVGVMLTASTQLTQAQDQDKTSGGVDSAEIAYPSQSLYPTLAIAQLTPPQDSEQGVDTTESPPTIQYKHPKLASALVALDEVYRQHGVAAVGGFDQLHPALLDNGRVLVEIRYESVRKAAVSGLLVSRGADIRHDIADTFIEAWVPIGELRRLVDDAAVYLVRPARLAQPAEGFVQVGASTSQGVALMNADDWHALGLTGEGVTIAIVDSFNSSLIATRQASGDWPSGAQLTMVDVDGGGFGDEGSSHGMATLEIAFDMAPGATFIAYETLTVGDWVTALGLADAAGADVTSASLSAPLDGIGDGTALSGSVAQAAASARTGGVLPVNATGNYRQQHWGGLFASLSGGTTHNWGLGGNINPFGASGTSTYYCFPTGYTLFSTLHWDDWVNVNQDYDLYLYRRNSSGSWTLVANSILDQNGGTGQTPEEAISYSVPSTDSTTSPGCPSGYKSYGLLVNRFSGTSNRNLQVFNFATALQISVEARSLGFPADSANVYSMAAIGRTTGTQESYSSEGPILSLGGGIPGTTTHAKPDAVSYAGVDTVSYGAGGFSGTSSATPHAAGAAVLLKQCDATLTPNGLDAALDALAAANDLGAAGHDFDYGFGNLILNNWTDSDRSDTPAYGEATHTRPNCPNAAAIPGIYLGSTVSLDSVALGQGGDDGSDDGVTANDDWVNGSTGSVNVTVGGQSGYLWGWVDLNCNGSFGDAGEQVFNAQAVNEGANNGLTFNVPTAFYTNCGDQDVYARFRVSATSAGTQAASNPTGSALGGEVEDYAWPISTLPVTLSSFTAQPTAGGVRFHWSTTTEVANVGFRIYEANADGRRLLNDDLILSSSTSGASPQHYSLFITNTSGEMFYLEDIDIRGKSRLHGPFDLGEQYGQAIEPKRINWTAIHAEQDTLAAQRQAANLDAARAAFSPTLQANAAGGIDVLVARDGLQRITYQDLLNIGIDPAGVPGSRLALTSGGQPVPLIIAPRGAVGPSTVIEFVGHALDSLYTDTNVYRLTVNQALAQRVTLDRNPVSTATPAAYYLATTTVENENTYSNLAPNGDPWYDTWMMAYGGSWSRDFTLTVDHLVAGPDPVLHLDVWGLTAWDADPDHRLQVNLNGTLVADETFDGLVSHPLDITLPAGLLQDGANTLTLTVPQPTDPSIWWDISILNSYGVTYPRAFVAVDDALTFTAAGDAFAVDGLTSSSVAVYRVSDSGVARVMRRQPTDNGDGTFRVKFNGSAESATYYVSTSAAMPAPTLRLARPFHDITSGSADYVMIAHSSFVDGLAPLVQFHSDNGLTVKVVDVEDVYAQFGHAIRDPHAIQAYLTHAVQNMGTHTVLLVGGDTYDYFDRLGLGSISFIPSLYGPTEPYVSFAPLDPLFTDVDGDAVPDAAIGRFPVRTVAELDTVIAKTLAYAAKDYGQTLVVAADKADGGISFRDASAQFIDRLPEGWGITTAYIDDVGVVDARAALLDSLNAGVALASFMGHSGPWSWTYSTPPFFTADDAAALTNDGRPLVVTQWGCWNTYHVDPAYDTLAHAFMLNGSGGAAAVLGATTLTQSSSEEALGMRVMPRIVAPGVTVGQGIQDAKADLALTNGALRDVLLGWTLLGDPALVIQP